MSLFLGVVTVPIIITWLFSEQLLRVIIPQPELAALAGQYLRILTIGAPGYALFEAGKRFMQAQGIFTASTCVLMVCAPLNALLNYVLVWVSKFLFSPLKKETITDMRIASKVWVWVCGCADIGGYCGLVDAVATVLVRAIHRRVRVLGRVYKARIRELGANGMCIIYHHSRESKPTIGTTD